jgi:hypothetical protein
MLPSISAANRVSLIQINTLVRGPWYLGSAEKEWRMLNLQIPTEAGQVFRRDAGRRSDLKPAAIPN